MSSFTRGVTNVDDLLTSTMDIYRSKLTEQWKTATPMLKGMKLVDVDGGNDIVENFEYQGNSTSGFVSKTSTVSTTIPQILTQGTFRFGWLTGSVGIQDFEEAQNNGKEAMLNLLETRIQNLKDKMKIDTETALGQASTPNANYFWSLPDIVDSGNPTLGNYGDIDRNTYSWWQAYEFASGSMALQGLEDMRLAHLTTSRDYTDPVDTILMTRTLFLAYQGRLTANEMFVSNKKGDLEFEHLSFMGVPIFPCGSLNTGLCIGYNSKYMELRINKHLKFKNQPFVRAPGGQSKSSLIQTQGQLVCVRPASNFKLTGMTA